MDGDYKHGKEGDRITVQRKIDSHIGVGKKAVDGHNADNGS